MPALLFLAQRLPYPPDKGEKIRAYHELRALARHHDIYLGCLIDDPADRAHIEALRPLCRDIHVAAINRRTARVGSLLGLLTNEALSVRYFRAATLAAWVREVMQRVKPETIFVYSSNTAPYVLDLPRAGRLVVDLVDVDSEKWRALAEAGSGPMRPIYHRERRLIAALEARVARESDACLFVSPAEAALFTAQHPAHADRIHGISNGVDHRFFAPMPAPMQAAPMAAPMLAPMQAAPMAAPMQAVPVAAPMPTPAADPPEFVFTGTMDYPPNIDAVVWFATDILKLIRRAAPQACFSQARFTIVGSNPAAAVRTLARQPGITVTGRVPDVRPYLSRATACVAPMRIARGIQNKVLEAMAMARPVVLTTGALEGIAATPGREVLLADSPQDFAAACCRLLDPAVGARIGNAARARILADYDWDATLRPLHDSLAAAAPLAAEPV